MCYSIWITENKEEATDNRIQGGNMKTKDVVLTALLGGGGLVNIASAAFTGSMEFLICGYIMLSILAGVWILNEDKKMR